MASNENLELKEDADAIANYDRYVRYYVGEAEFFPDPLCWPVALCHQQLL